MGKSGVGVLGLLGVAFVVLKLTEVIDWSWWWVLIPFWGPLVIATVIVVCWGIVMALINSKPSRYKHDHSRYKD